MIGSVSAKRANAFAQALDTAVLEGVPEDVEIDDPEQARLLAVAGGIAALPAPSMDPEVKAVQRAQLIAAMEQQFAGGGSGGQAVPEQRRRGAHRADTSPLSKLRPQSKWSRGVAIGGLGVGVAAGSFSGVAAASSDALPGDTLYGLKRGMEDVKLTLADGDGERGRLYLDNAATRLNEARRLMERQRAGDLDEESVSEVRKTLQGVRHDAGEGHRLLHDAYEKDRSAGPIQSLSAFSKSHRAGWDQLRQQLPVQLDDVGQEVDDVFDAIDDELGPLSSLLPPDEDSADRGRSTGTDPGRDSGSPDPSPSSSSSSDGEAGKDDKKQPSDDASDGKDGGLIGDGGLIDTKPSEGGKSSGSSTPPPDSGKSPDADVTIPPLLPGLPGLGLDAEDDEE
ncbi:DUF5667 domain-containing protein [Streptomyces boninensis]|uniref:DUF5667 domain-containing protein n=1 Tax=Streptomyces boninensis TaxID=2039455 RepID=UPI003B21C458